MSSLDFSAKLFLFQKAIRPMSATVAILLGKLENYPGFLVETRVEEVREY
jgi:hypothetical protein